MTIKDIINYLDAYAPQAYQESYDNSGLLTGDPSANIQGVTVSLDVTEDVIDDAIAHGSNLIVAHHPLIFKGLKKITGHHWVERCIIKAIKHDIAIYAIHTNLDHVHNGVNTRIAHKLGLINPQVLSPKKNTLSKLVTFVPSASTSEVLEALHQAGGGHIGNYDHCSFQTDGTGTFKPNNKANPTIGEANQQEQVAETRIEVIFPTHSQRKILSALLKAHPYEEVAHYVTHLDNQNQEVGSGMIGLLPHPIPTGEFLQSLKQSMQTAMIRHTKICKDRIHKVAVCGGAGSFLLSNAMAQNADIFITADFKYHDFFEADGQIIVADIGHYESEQFTKDLLYEIISKKFTNIAVRLTGAQTNPIFYL